MAVRVRSDGRVLCAARHPEAEGDTYLDDGLHYKLSVELRVLVTEAMNDSTGRGGHAQHGARLMDDDPILFVLLAAFAVVFILFLHDMSNTPVVSLQKTAKKASLYAPCSTPTPAHEGDPLDYDDVYNAEHELCNTRYFPYCHALPIPFYRQLDETYLDDWPDLGCARDLVPDATCVQEMPPAETHRGHYTFIENDLGCVEP